MTPGERLREVERLFHLAGEVAACDRDAFLRAECPDPELRAQVVRLFDASMDAAGVLARAVSVEVESAAHFARTSLEGRRLGTYRILRMLDVGGMGAVYRAVRDDDEFRKEVAIKVLPRGLDTAGMTTRFLRERQILANLEHPHIVRLLDGGTTADGVPFIVMELVEGEKITDWCNARACGVRERVRLFLKVCDAVQFAHQRLIVHRDIKPSNVLVTADGSPKLLDFGIAKLLDDDAARLGAATRTGLFPLTPHYASPEQLRGEAVTAATDVYSLGALLYELLAGVRPHQTDKTGIELARLVCETDPPAPSAVAPAEVRRQIRGDLDDIVIKALQKSPSARYGSAEQLAADLTRWLEARPVLARHAGFGYRAGRYVRRYRYAVAAALTVLVALSAATWISMLQARRADEQARRAEERFQQVRAVANSFLFEVDEKVRNLPGATEARQLVVARALQYLDGLAREPSADPALAAELALAYKKVADIQGSPLMANLGRFDEALESYQRALAILREADMRGDGATRAALVEAYFDVGFQEQFLGRMSEGRRMFEQGLRLAERLRASGAASADRLMTIGYVRLSSIDQRMGDLDAAYRSVRSSVEAATRWTTRDHSPRAQYERAVAEQRYASIVAVRGDAEQALRSVNEARAIHETLARDDPNNVTYQREIAYTNWCAGTYAWQDAPGALSTEQAPAAVAFHRRAVSGFEAIAAADRDDARAQSEVGVALSSLAGALAYTDAAEALAISDRAVSLLERLQDPVSRSQLPGAMRAGARALARNRQTRKALAVLDRAAAIANEIAARSPDDDEEFQVAVAVERDRAVLLDGNGRPAEALALLEEQVRKTSARSEHHRDPGLRALLADLYLDLGRLRVAAPRAAEAGCPSYHAALDIWNSWPFPSTSAVDRRRHILEALVAACR